MCEIGVSCTNWGVVGWGKFPTPTGGGLWMPVVALRDFRGPRGHPWYGAPQLQENPDTSKKGNRHAIGGPPQLQENPETNEKKLNGMRLKTRPGGRHSANYPSLPPCYATNGRLWLWYFYHGFCFLMFVLPAHDLSETLGLVCTFELVNLSKSGKLEVMSIAIVLLLRCSCGFCLCWLQ